MKHLWSWTLLLVLAVALIANTVIADEPAGEDKPVNAYVGDSAKKCKMCHKDQVAAWEKWSKAMSWDVLSDEEKANDECIACHVTGYGEPGGFTSEKDTPNLTGVQCEACHGPAGDHMKVPMTDKEKRKETMSKPSADVCITCHKEEGNPNYVEFKYDEAVKGLADHLKAKD